MIVEQNDDLQVSRRVSTCRKTLLSVVFVLISKDLTLGNCETKNLGLNPKTRLVQGPETWSQRDSGLSEATRSFIDVLSVISQY